MKEFLLLLPHLLSAVTWLLGTGGAKALAMARTFEIDKGVIRQVLAKQVTGFSG